MLPDEDSLERAGLLLEVADSVATITLDKPDKRNCQTPTMWYCLADIGVNLPEDISVVVINGAGASFSAGIDLRMFAPDGLEGERGFEAVLASSDQEVADTIDGYQRGFTWLADPRFVSIAAVQGHAIGAGFQLALACDLRVVADDVRFCMKEPALGLVPDLAGTKPLVEAVGYPRAMEICATTREIGAVEAVQIGLAVTAVPTADLTGATSDLVSAILANPPGAVRETKALLQGSGSRDLDSQRLAERQAQVRRFRALHLEGGG